MKTLNCECGYATNDVRKMEKHFKKEWTYSVDAHKVVKFGHTMLVLDE